MVFSYSGKSQQKPQEKELQIFGDLQRPSDNRGVPGPQHLRCEEAFGVRFGRLRSRGPENDKILAFAEDVFAQCVQQPGQQGELSSRCLASNFKKQTVVCVVTNFLVMTMLLFEERPQNCHFFSGYSNSVPKKGKTFKNTRNSSSWLKFSSL